MPAHRRLRSLPAAALVVAAAVSSAGCGATFNEHSNASLLTSDKAGAGSAGSGSFEPVAKAEAARAADKLTAVAKPGSTAYKIGAQDVLEISVFKVAELSRTVQVADSGTINLPLVGEVETAGKTAQDVERDLTTKLGAKYLQKPQVTVFVKEFNSQRVTVEGAVKKPGVYPYRGRNSLLQMIAMAEGLTDGADATVVVFRQKDSRRTAARFDVSQIRSGQADDPAIQSGDIIVAGSSALKEGFNTFIKLLPVTSVFALL